MMTNRKILATIMMSFFLLGCASYNPDISASTTNVQVKRILKSEMITQDESTMPSTDPINPSPETEGEANQQPADLLLLGDAVFNFDQGEPGWYTVDDNVMGGVSSSTVNIQDSGILSFQGTMSLENNGGFSSVRSDWRPIDLSNADGVLLRVSGDGKVYRLRIQSASTGGEIAYNAIFETNPDRWDIVYIPFADMVPTYRGFVMNVGKLDAKNIGSFGFMLSDKQTGEFELQVDWIRAISQKDLPVTGMN
jgi:monofunctional biosynthetic peptidoglycan transglycosylase